MNDPKGWQEANEKYLAASVAWLRLRLERLAAPASSAIIETAPSPASPVVAVVPKRAGWFRYRVQAPAPAEVTPQPAPVVAAAGFTDADVAAAAKLMEEAEAIDPKPALVQLGDRFGLDPLERHVMLLCAAMELDTRIAGLCARAQDDPSRPYPTFALALALFPEEQSWQVVSPERPLRYWRLIEISQPAFQPLSTSALRADERIVNYLKGLAYLDDRLVPLLLPVSAQEDAGPLPPSQQEAVDTILHSVTLDTRRQRLPVMQLLGTDTPSKQIVAARAAASLGLELFRLSADLLPSQVAELEMLGRLWERESILLPVALYLDAQEVARQQSEAPPPLFRFLARSQGVIFLDTRDVQPKLGRQSISIDLAKPTPSEQKKAWETLLGEGAGDIPSQLAGQFNMNIAEIRETAAAAQPPTLENLWEHCLLNTRPRLDLLAQRIDPKATWEDIVLPAEDRDLLHEIADQVKQRSRVYEDWGFRDRMNRGLGISALFVGESGTGKTMAAEVIANQLRLNLYRIDLSAVVSKFIGETEKNLRRLFDAAEDGGAILFFDEADALFGKRSEVKDSHDRYANIEINYLLQRMEAYRGLAILATNMKSALDPAFLRRLRFVVQFVFPGPADRKKIWQRVFPPQVPGVATLDFDRLARLNFTGGSIQNVALNAAFLAAQAGAPISMPIVLGAARTEFRKLEQPFNEADLRWPLPGAVA
jgi:hypothetical protein